jgi:hypothetical protein
MGKDGSLKNDEGIANYLSECKKNDYLSKSREKLIRRAINRLYRLRKEK